MRWKNVKLIFLREVRDQLRDRRTLFMIAVLPLLLYPGLGIGMFQMTTLFEEQRRVVVIVGADELPADPPLLDGDHIASQWFTIPAEAATLAIVTDRRAAGDSNATRSADDTKMLAQADEVRGLYQQRAGLETELDKIGENQTAEFDRVSGKLDEINRRLSDVFSGCDFQVLVVFPKGFAESLARENRLVAERQTKPDAYPVPVRPVLIHNDADKKSQQAHDRLKKALESWEDAILARRLQEAHLPETFPKPVDFESVDLASKSEISNSVWSMFFPALLVIMAVTGAFYPSVDLAAGEKERGTMETLLICPATRTEIVLGKFLTVLLFSISTALLNMMSMGLTGKYMASMGGGALAKVGDLSFPSPLAFVWVGVLLIPLASLFSALCLALATFARSSKEGQYYLTPLLMVTMGLTVFCLSPAVEITPFYSMIPIVGPALLLKELIAAPDSTEPLLYAVPVLASSFIYSLLALWWAIEQFSREDVLFREAERFDLGLWFKHLLRDKEATPSFAEAGIYFVLVLLLQFASMGFIQDAIRNTEPADRPFRTLQLQMIYLVATVGAPALFMGVILTRNFRQTFRLNWPKWSMLAAAVILPFALNPLSIELMHHMRWFFPKLPAEVEKALAAMNDSSISLGIIVLTFAAIPAVCEELAFRGFMLSGFGRSRRKWLAIVLSSLAFGIMHQIPQQVFNATLLGLVLGVLAVRSNSLLPSVVFHFIFNSLEIFRSRLEIDALEKSPVDWMFRTVHVGDQTEICYSWPTLLICAAVAAVILSWLVRKPTIAPAVESFDRHDVAAQSLNNSSAAAKPTVRVG